MNIIFYNLEYLLYTQMTSVDIIKKSENHGPLGHRFFSAFSYLQTCIIHNNSIDILQKHKIHFTVTLLVAN